MKLKSLHIISFGGLQNRDIALSGGVNVIEGANESGKSSAAMFIKFIFYGLSSKTTKNSPSERQRYINKTTGQAAGYIMAEDSRGTLYRLERALITSDGISPRERVRIINQSTGEVISGQNPGEYFFGVPVDVFVNTCFLSQAESTRPELSGIGQTRSGGAVENLLTSADENVDIKRAITNLDSTRRTLLHKNKNGGEISDLKERRSALAAEIVQNSEKAAEIVSVSTSLEDIKRRIAELEEAEERYNGIFSALDKITLQRRIDSASQTRARIEKMQKSLTALDNSPLGKGFAQTLADSERDIRAYDEECAVFDEKIADLANTEPEEELPDPSDVMEEIRAADTSSRTRFAAAIALIIAAVIGLAASVLLYIFNTDAYIFPLVMTLILTVLGVVLMIKHTASARTLEHLLADWDAESVEDAETAVEEKLEEMSRSQMFNRLREEMTASLESAKLRFDAAEERIGEFAKAAHISDSDDIYKTIAQLQKIADGIGEERSSMQAKIVHLKGRLEAIEEQLDGVDISQAELEAYTAAESEYGKIAAELDNDGIKNAAKERDFTVNALKAAQGRRSSLEEKLAELGRLSRTPDEMTTMISAIDERIDELTMRHDALELAENAIKKAGESMRSGVIPRISASASLILSGATPHERLILDGSWNASLSDGGDIISHEHLSRGTSDLTYIALRIALAGEIFKAEQPTLILDESFAHIDGGRIKNMFRQLSDGQYIVFTCRRDEADAARELGCAVVELG